MIYLSRSSWEDLRLHERAWWHH